MLLALFIGKTDFQWVIRRLLTVLKKKGAGSLTGCIHFKKYPYFWVCRKKKITQKRI